MELPLRIQSAVKIITCYMLFRLERIQWKAPVFSCMLATKHSPVFVSSVSVPLQNKATEQAGSIFAPSEDGDSIIYTSKIALNILRNAPNASMKVSRGIGMQR